MQSYFTKKQQESVFTSVHLKQDFFNNAEDISNPLSFIQQNQISKFKIPRVNTEEAKSIFIELNKKSATKQSSSKKNWKFEEACLLVYLVDKFSSSEKVPCLNDLSSSVWEEISQFLPGRSSKDCKYKLLSLTASTITNIPWSIEERNILTEIIEEQGMNWNAVSQKLYERSDKKVYRTSKQCRQHYMCFLKPNLKKGAWTEQQDYKLVCLFLEFGRKWSKIMKFIEGRNQNSIKNRFFLLFENKGKTSNQSDLLRKVKRRKQRMEKTLKETDINFKFTTQQVVESQIDIQKNWDRDLDLEMEMQKEAVQPETKKGDAIQLSQCLLKLEQNEQISRKDLNNCLISRNHLSICNLKSYQHLDFSQLQFNHMDPSSIEAFEQFEQFICF